jgi:hypothetical protein
VFRSNRFLAGRLRDRHFSASAAVTLAGRITTRVISLSRTTGEQFG